jgi:hypothetical protein
MQRGEFDALGPAELADLHRAWIEREFRSDYRAAVVASAMGPKLRDVLERFWTWREIPQPELTMEQEEAKLDSLAAALGASDQ